MNTTLFFLPMFPQADLVGAFLRANPAGRVLVVLLLIGSVIAWSIMMTKFREYRRAYREAKRFLAVYQGELHPIALIMKRPSFPNCPLYMMYRTACRTLHGLIEAHGINPAEWFGGQSTVSAPKLNDTDMKIVRNIIDQTADEQVIQIEKNVVVLATVVTAAPFIGLMGTVWGDYGCLRRAGHPGSGDPFLRGSGHCRLTDYNACRTDCGAPITDRLQHADQPYPHSEHDDGPI